MRRAKKRVLIVDDDQSIADLLRDILEEDYAVSVADSLAALAAAEQIRPHVILTDLNMPQSSGESLIGRLRSSPVTAATPILIVSAFTLRGEYAAEHGADGYLAKPFRTDDLLRAIAALVGGRCPTTETEKEHSV